MVARGAGAPPRPTAGAGVLDVDNLQRKRAGPGLYSAVAAAGDEREREREELILKR